MFFFFKVSMLLKEERCQNISTGRLNQKHQKCKCSYWRLIGFFFIFMKMFMLENRSWSFMYLQLSIFKGMNNEMFGFC